MCRSQGIVAQSKNITGKDNSNGLKVRIARLESVVERLSKLPPDQAAEMVSDASSYIHLQLPTSTSNTKEMAEALERQLRAIPPVLALFNNEIVCTATRHILFALTDVHRCELMKTSISHCYQI